ncbi:hypothetical protein EDB89DRAFT_1494435 [Lactarius sanguifluus]|nr:hypothetical protein EDB89DRAFT_1494435 [Lactarius sanguifluus]
MKVLAASVLRALVVTYYVFFTVLCQVRARKALFEVRGSLGSRWKLRTLGTEGTLQRAGVIWTTDRFSQSPTIATLTSPFSVPDTACKYDNNVVKKGPYVCFSQISECAVEHHNGLYADKRRNDLITGVGEHGGTFESQMTACHYPCISRALGFARLMCFPHSTIHCSIQ